MNGSMDNSELVSLAEQKFEELQSRIYGEINALLKYAKLNALDVLKNRTPTYSESAAILKQYVGIIEKLQDMGIPIPKQAIVELEKIVTIFTSVAVAIDQQDVEGLGAAIAALDCEPYIL